MPAVPAANHVTAYWVELSEEAGRPVRELGHKRVTCAPLPHALPLPGMARVRCLKIWGLSTLCQQTVRRAIKALMQLQMPAVCVHQVV